MNKMEELSQTKIEQLNKQPIVETSVAKSADGKWFLHKTTITSIYPRSYMDKVMDSKEKEETKKKKKE
jgi:hypothetical protein